MDIKILTFKLKNKNILRSLGTQSILDTKIEQYIVRFADIISTISNGLTKIFKNYETDLVSSKNIN